MKARTFKGSGAYAFAIQNAGQVGILKQKTNIRRRMIY